MVPLETTTKKKLITFEKKKTSSSSVIEKEGLAETSDTSHVPADVLFAFQL